MAGKSELERVTAAECASIHAGLHAKLGAMEEKMDTHFKSIEVNMISSFAQVTVRQDRANDAVAKLKESDIRRDEREKMQEKVIANMRWYVLAGIAAAGLVAGLVQRFV